MAAAALIAFEETRQSFAKTRARQQLHAYLDGWLERLETHMPDDTPSLEALTQAVLALRQELTGRITQALVEQQPARVLHQRTMPCPQCQCSLSARPTPPRTVHTMVGEVSLSRPYCYCSHCQQGFSPLDDVLQLSERRTPWDLQKAGARLAEQAHAWVEAMMARLFWGDVDWAIEGLEALQPRDSPAAEEIRKLIGFLRNSAGRLHDRAARKGGYPIGSGGIEAANKCISHVRLKRSGAWWSIEQANRMLALRCAIYNGTFARVFETSKRKVLQRHRGNPL